MMKRRLSKAILCLALCAASSSWAEEPAGAIARFDISRFDVDGNTLLPAAEMNNLLTSFTGKNRNFGDVQRALEALEGAYHNRGYNMVQVLLPEQELNQGVVHLKVVETRIGKVGVEGNNFFDAANIRRSLPDLREGEVPNIDKISAGLHMANENPAKKAAMQLKSSDKDGEVDASLVVQDSKPWTVGVNLDNTGNSSTGEDHIGVVYQNANLFGLDHVLSLQYTTTLQKPSKVSVYGFGYHMPLYALGDSIDLYGSYSDVDSGSVTAGVFDLQISGKGTLLGARYNHNFGRSKEYESKLIYGFDYKAYQNNVLLAPSVQLGNDVTVHPLSLTYTGLWTLPRGEVSYFLGALHNIPGGSKGDSATFNLARTGATASYKMLRYGITFNRGIGTDWQGRLALNGQFTRDALIPGEQFGVGGGSSVRGYQEREVADDSGYSVSAELYTPNLCVDSSVGLAQCRLLVFAEGAHVSHNDALPGEQTSMSIGSVGFGFRLLAQKYFNMQMDAGHALRDGVTTVKGDNRLHVRMNFSY